SMAGWMPVPGRAGYCSAKSALAQFFEVLRMEEAANGIHILMVYPSFLDTPIEKNALGGDGGPARHARSTLGRIDSAGELAQNIVHALNQKKPRLFPNKFTLFASILWRIAPSLFQRLTLKRFAVELEQR
ncbi:MAG TPA: short-chain dehydrogenase, partial [Spongiibacteraceae bacterium]|nr:short-chain dehydrogenase [Spongiibacteraceae bacterium]